MEIYKEPQSEDFMQQQIRLFCNKGHHKFVGGGCNCGMEMGSDGKLYINCVVCNGRFEYSEELEDQSMDFGSVFTRNGIYNNDNKRI